MSDIAGGGGVSRLWLGGRGGRRGKEGEGGGV